MSAHRIWIWIAENTWLAVAAVVAAAIVALWLGQRSVTAFLVMLVGLLLMRRAEFDRQRSAAAGER